MPNKSRFLIVFALLVFLSLADSVYTGYFPSYVDYGRHPVWLSNEEIIFASKVLQFKPIHRFILNPIEFYFTYVFNDAAPPTQRIVRADYYICSIRIDGTGEKIIKQSAIIYDEKEKPVKEIMIENGKETPTEVVYPGVIDVFSKKDLIVFDNTIGQYVNGNITKGIFLMKSDGTDLKKISPEGANPRFSPDGTKILYETHVEYPNPRYEGVATNATDPRFSQLKEAGEPISIVERGLWVMDTDGGNKHKIVDGYNPYSCWSRWHPTENKVYYSPAVTNGKRGESALWLIDPATSKKIKIDDAYQCAYKCHISPDSKKIVYATENKMTDNKGSWAFESLWVADSDGTSKKRIAGNMGGYGNWNPEGKVVFNLYNENDWYTFYTYDVETDRIDSQIKLPKDTRFPMGWFRGNKWFCNSYVYNVNSKEKSPVKIVETGDLDVTGGGPLFWSPDYSKFIIKGSRRIRKEKEGKNTNTGYNDHDDQGWYIIDENGGCKLLLRGG